MVNQDIRVIENPAFDVQPEFVVFPREVVFVFRGDFFFDDEVEGWMPRDNSRISFNNSIATEHQFMDSVSDSLFECSIWREDTRPANGGVALEPVECVFEPVFVRVCV